MCTRESVHTAVKCTPLYCFEVSCGLPTLCRAAEFWQRYVRWLEANSPEAAEGALQRAVLLHCKRRAELLLFAARFYERHGMAAAARSTYEQLLGHVAPGLVEVGSAGGGFAGAGCAVASFWSGLCWGLRLGTWAGSCYGLLLHTYHAGCHMPGLLAQ